MKRLVLFVRPIRDPFVEQRSFGETKTARKPHSRHYFFMRPSFCIVLLCDGKQNQKKRKKKKKFAKMSVSLAHNRKRKRRIVNFYLCGVSCAHTMKNIKRFRNLRRKEKLKNASNLLQLSLLSKLISI